MLPLSDTHVHLLAGLDDGPRSDDEALALCRMLVAEGANAATALAHQNPSYPENTAARLTAASARLADQLRAANVPLTVYPVGEVMLSSDTVAEWKSGRLQSFAGSGKHLLVEMPHGVFLDPRGVAAELRRLGVRPVIAHAERYDPLLHDPHLTVECIAAGCLIQVTAEAFAEFADRDAAALRHWARHGMIHLIGSDGHRLDRRPPRLRAGYRVLERWVGVAAAERIGGIWGGAVLQGLSVNPPPPKPPARKGWFTRLFGG
jgi:protein-tyrosine phosphatase